MAEVRSVPIGNKPVLALDVDGVLVVSGENPPSDYHLLLGSSGEDYFNPEHGQWLTELLPYFDAYYLTSHFENAHDNIGRHLDLPLLDWINFTLFQDTQSLHLNDERRLTLASFFPERPIVWIDNDLEEIDLKWAEQRSAEGIPTLAIKPSHETGLQRMHIEEIHFWLGQQSIRGSTL